jgi:DNA mismatch repair protein MutS2
MGEHSSLEFSCNVLEFSGVLELLRRFLSGPISAPTLAALRPQTELAIIREDLERVREAMEYLREGGRPSFASLPDPRPLLDRLSIEGMILDPLEVLTVLGLMRMAGETRTLFSDSPCRRLDALAQSVPDLSAVSKKIEGKILPDGTLDSSASSELARLRRAIERMRRELQSALEKLLHRLSDQDVVQDAVVTVRNERFVIPVRAEAKRRVAGVLHGSSASAATVFLEPLETVSLNNDLVEMQNREEAEIRRILAAWSGELRARIEDLRQATETLGELDLLFARADFSKTFDACLPEFSGERVLELREVRHPLLEAAMRAHKQRPVPLTMELRAPKTLMVISGPNTGGKTVALKTVGLAALMAQAGIPVIAQQARLPLFGRVLADIGDAQSIQDNLSTFSGHVRNIQAMIEKAGRDDLVLLDELGGSTEPNEGASLAVAILEDFRAREAMTFVTTHHSRLKAYGVESPAAVNAAMEFDEATLQPTYRLLVGLPGKSSGIEIAARLGLKSEIVEKARALLHPSETEASSLIASLHAQQAQLENELRSIAQRRAALAEDQRRLEETFERERRARLRELDARLEQELRKAETRWERTLKETLAREDSKKRATELKDKFQRKASALKSDVREEWNAQIVEALGTNAAQPAETLGPPEVGDAVRVSGFQSPGTVISISEGEVEVEIGRLRMRVREDELQVLGRAAAADKAHGAGTVRTPPGRMTAPTEAPAEINVIGKTAEEADEAVDKFLDQAFLAGRARIRVVHGHGKGILRRALHEMFSTHPQVEKFYFAPREEGGEGATIVELKL